MASHIERREFLATLGGAVASPLAAGRSRASACGATIAGVSDAAIEDVADRRLHLRNDRAERVPVIWIAGQCCGMGDELPAGGNVSPWWRRLPLTPNS